MQTTLCKKVPIDWAGHAALLVWRDLFNRIDVNDDGMIDFNEFLVLVAIRNKLGNVEQRLAFVFDLFVFLRCFHSKIASGTVLFSFRWDDSEDGHIDRKELTNLITAMVRKALHDHSLFFYDSTIELVSLNAKANGTRRSVPKRSLPSWTSPEIRSWVNKSSSPGMLIRLTDRQRDRCSAVLGARAIPWSAVFSCLESKTLEKTLNEQIKNVYEWPRTLPPHTSETLEVCRRFCVYWWKERSKLVIGKKQVLCGWNENIV
jgi:hypothetical protein